MERHEDFTHFWLASAQFPANFYYGQKNVAGQPPAISVGAHDPND